MVVVGIIQRIYAMFLQLCSSGRRLMSARHESAIMQDHTVLNAARHTDRISANLQNPFIGRSCLISNQTSFGMGGHFITVPTRNNLAYKHLFPGRDTPLCTRVVSQLGCLTSVLLDGTVNVCDLQEWAIKLLSERADSYSPTCMSSTTVQSLYRNSHSSSCRIITSSLSHARASRPN